MLTKLKELANTLDRFKTFSLDWNVELKASRWYCAGISRKKSTYLVFKRSLLIKRKIEVDLAWQQFMWKRQVYVVAKNAYAILNWIYREVQTNRLDK